MGNFAAQWVTMTAIMASHDPPPAAKYTSAPNSTLFQVFAMKNEGDGDNRGAAH